MPASTSASTSSTFSCRIDVLRSISAGVPADLLAPVVEDAAQLLHRLHVAEAVPDVRVLGRDAQRHLLAAAADADRDLPHRSRVELLPALLDDRQVAVEVAAGCRPCRTRSRTPRSRVRTSPEPMPRISRPSQMWSTVRAMSASRLGLRYELHVTSADLRALRCLRERGEHRPALEVLPIRVAAQREEVIHVHSDSTPSRSASSQAARMSRQSPCWGSER